MSLIAVPYSPFIVSASPDPLQLAVACLPGETSDDRIRMRVDDLLDRHSGKVLAFLGDDDAVQDGALKHEIEILEWNRRDDAGLHCLGE